jgi:hypothetical protein
MLSANDLTTAEGRARAAEAALTAVAEHPDDLVRDQYVMQLADRCRVDAARLREKLDHVRAHPPAEPVRRSRYRRDEPPPTEYPEDDTDGFGPSDNSEAAAASALRPGPGLEALKLAVHRPEDVAERVHPVLFGDAVQRDAYRALLEHDSVHDAVEASTPEVAIVLRRVVVEEPLAGDPELGDPVDSVVAGLVRGATMRALADMEIESRTAGDDWRSQAAETAQVRIWLDQLEVSAAGRDVAVRLVAWLAERETNVAGAG